MKSPIFLAVSTVLLLACADDSSTRLPPRGTGGDGANGGPDGTTSGSFGVGGEDDVGVGPGTTGAGATSSGTQVGGGTSGTDVGGTTSGSGGFGTTGSGGSFGTGGASSCYSCAEYLTECIANDPPAPDCGSTLLCVPSSQIFFELVTCVCNDCSMPCVNTCAGQSGDGDACALCQQNSVSGACSETFAACANDI
jgi:hypothetical protein